MWYGVWDFLQNMVGREGEGKWYKIGQVLVTEARKSFFYFCTRVKSSVIKNKAKANKNRGVPLTFQPIIHHNIGESVGTVDRGHLESCFFPVLTATLDRDVSYSLCITGGLNEMTQAYSHLHWFLTQLIWTQTAIIFLEALISKILYVLFREQTVFIVFNNNSTLCDKNT